jgi:hypothetical protein
LNASVAVLVTIIVIAAVAACFIFVFMPGPRKSLMDAKFILHDAEGPNAGGAFARELGINTIPIYLDHAWSGVEPTDNGWVWSDVFPSNINEYGHSMLRIGILHVLAWSPTDIPSWVNKDNLDGEFREEYG